MKILELCLSPDLGGLELYAFRCADALTADGEVFIMLNPRGRLLEYFKGGSLAYDALTVSFPPLPLLAAKKLAGYLDEHEIDIIHIHWGKDLPLAALAKWLSRSKPKLICSRQMQITRHKRDLYHEFIYGQLDQLITISKQLAERTKGFLDARHRAKVQTLYYGVNEPEHFVSIAERESLREQHGIPKNMFLVGLFGRIKYAKGQHLLIDAMVEAKRQGIDMAGLVVGTTIEDDYKQKLIEKCQDNGIAGNVRFLDFVKKPQELMQICDCVVLSSFEETFGLVLVEAMRSGVAVIGSAGGGVPEIIDDGETGLLFSAGDSEMLLEKLLLLRNNSEQRARIAAAGKAKADRMFNTQAHFKTLRAIMQSLVENSATQPPSEERSG